jgi:hypothetical protein
MKKALSTLTDAPRILVIDVAGRRGGGGRGGGCGRGGGGRGDGGDAVPEVLMCRKEAGNPFLSF